MTKRCGFVDNGVTSLIVELILLELLAGALLILVEVVADFLSIIDFNMFP